MRYFSLILCVVNVMLQAQNVSTIATNSGITDALVFNASGNLTGSDYYGGKIFEVDLSNGFSTLLAEGFTSANGLVFDSNGTLFLADNLGNTIYKIFPDGSREVFVNFFNPSSLIFELDSDTLIAASYAQKKIVKISPDGKITNWSSGGNLSGGPNGFVYDEMDNLYVCNFDDRKITQIHPDGSQTLITQAPGGGAMGGIAYSNGFIYGSLLTTHKIFRTDLDGNGEIFLGSTIGTVDGDAAIAKFSSPNGILPSESGDTLYISDLNTSNIRMVTNLGASVNTIEAETKSSFITITPNPGRELLEISLDLLHAGGYSIDLYNGQGKHIKSILTASSLNPGIHQFKMDGSNLSPGHYYLLIQNGKDKIFTKKLVIL